MSLPYLWDRFIQSLWVALKRQEAEVPSYSDVLLGTTNASPSPARSPSSVFRCDFSAWRNEDGEQAFLKNNTEGRGNDPTLHFANLMIFTWLRDERDGWEFVALCRAKNLSIRMESESITFLASMARWVHQLATAPNRAYKLPPGWETACQAEHATSSPERLIAHHKWK